MTQINTKLNKPKQLNKINAINTS